MGNCPICKEDSLEYGKEWIKGLGRRITCWNCKWIGYTHEPEDYGYLEPVEIED